MPGPRNRRMKIAMIGQKGVPATWGGIEHHVEQLGARYSDRGHEVVVYCRESYETEQVPTHRGMFLRHQRAWNTKHFEAIAHSGLATLSSLCETFDVIHYHALGPGLMSPIARSLTRAKVVQTVHGLDQDRDKWGRVATGVLELGCWVSGHVPHETMVVSRALERYYWDRFGRRSTYIGNGVNRPGIDLPGKIAGGSISKGRPYVVYVGRLVPEKAPDLLIRAFAQLPTEYSLVLAGGSSHTDGYCDLLHELARDNSRIILPGYVQGAALQNLYANAAAFVLPSRVEGLPLTLLEAASYGLPLIVSDIEPHQEVVPRSIPGARLFRAGDEAHLAEVLGRVLGDLPAERLAAAANGEHICRRFDWDEVADISLDVYERAIAAPVSKRVIVKRPTWVLSGSGRGRVHAVPAPDRKAEVATVAPLLQQVPIVRPREVETL